ncbi:MAG: hypothetical protein GYB65_19890 [Chloroflexi bacterium]|nr:hypothetical protein [Chloroflexota bacterium]
MSKASDFVGKPIVTQSGEKIETIDDIVFDPEIHQVLCFIIAPGGGWFGGARILPWSTAVSITDHAIIISSQAQIVFARTLSRIQTLLENKQVLTGKKLVAPNGQRLGMLSDIYFDRDTGAIRVYEVSATIGHTGSSQRALLKPDEVDFIQGDGGTLRVSPPTADVIERQIDVG